jgi:multidrug efflux system outer membrane protein
MPIFEAGALQANIQRVRGRYRELDADYRGQVLAAFRDVEDALLNVHVQAREAENQTAAVNSSRQSLELSQLQYKQGLVSYLQVIDAERTLLSNELTAVQILQQRLTGTVLLIKAIGGGWEAPTPDPDGTRAHASTSSTGVP